MSLMSGILILRYIQLQCEIPFVSYCFQLHKIVYIFGTVSPILMRFSAKQSSLNAFTNQLQNKHLIVPDIRLISLNSLLPKLTQFCQTRDQIEIQNCEIHCNQSIIATGVKRYGYYPQKTLALYSNQKSESHSGGDTYVNLLRAPASPSPKDPHIFTISPKDPIFQTKIVCCHPKPQFFRKFEILTPNDSHFLKFFETKTDFLLQSGAIFTKRSQNIRKC